jgi:hypothetical protein
MSKLPTDPEALAKRRAKDTKAPAVAETGEVIYCTSCGAMESPQAEPHTELCARNSERV